MTTNEQIQNDLAFQPYHEYVAESVLIKLPKWSRNLSPSLVRALNHQPKLYKKYWQVANKYQKPYRPFKPLLEKFILPNLKPGIIISHTTLTTRLVYNINETFQQIQKLIQNDPKNCPSEFKVLIQLIKIINQLTITDPWIEQDLQQKKAQNGHLDIIDKFTYSFIANYYHPIDLAKYPEQNVMDLFKRQNPSFDRQKCLINYQANQPTYLTLNQLTKRFNVNNEVIKAFIDYLGLTAKDFSTDDKQLTFTPKFVKQLEQYLKVKE